MEITGVYGKTLLRNDLTGGTVFTFNTESCVEYKNERGMLICKGIISTFASGTPLKLVGDIQRSSKGWEFVTSSAEGYSNKEELTIKYLCSDSFAGIGEKTAQKIVSVTGADIFEFVKNEDAKERLLAVVKPKIVDSLLFSLRNSFKQKLIWDYIAPYGGTYADASRIANTYATNGIEVLKKNCYLVGVAAGLPFFLCDSIAQSEGYFAYDERRIRALLVYAMKSILSQGHTCADLSTIYKGVNAIAKSSAFADTIPRGILLRSLIKEKDFTMDKTVSSTVFYLTEIHKAESDLARHARRLQTYRKKLPFFDDIAELMELNTEINYSDAQRSAFDFLKTTGIKILTGGPGTGKSTVVNGIIKAYTSLNRDNRVLLCAPTGRAAQKLFEITGYEAKTMHRALDIVPMGEDIKYKTLEDPLDYGLIVIDETSMADVTIVSMLLGAVKNNSVVILCGDINQLPSVGPGSVLKDMIDSGRFESVTLDVIYRQEGTSAIVTNAARINSGSTSLLNDANFKIISVNSAEEIKEKVKELVGVLNDPKDIFKLQVLSSTKKGAAGTKELNTSLQPICNPRSEHLDGSVVNYGPYQYCSGDKVMMISNNYKAGYLNGDVGTILHINESSFIVQFPKETLEIGRGDLNDMVPALAITIHKSQGGEYETVIVALPAEPNIMLQRNLLYTAVTRAKKNIIIVEERGAVIKAIKTINNNIRLTNLKERLIH